MAFYLVAHIPPPTVKARIHNVLIGAVSAKNEAHADELAEERYPMRSGWMLDLVECKTFHDVMKGCEFLRQWHCRNEFWEPFAAKLGIKP